MLSISSIFLLVIAVVTRLAQADFMVYTEPPIPTSAIPSFSNPSDAASWTTSVALNVLIAQRNHRSSLGSAYQSSESSAASEIAAFVATASNYSIPAVVTDSKETTTYYSQPNWYTALPSGARAFKEQQVADQFSIIRSVIARGATSTAASSTGAAMPTATAFLDAKFGVLAAAAAAAFL